MTHRTGQIGCFNIMLFSGPYHRLFPHVREALESIYYQTAPTAFLFYFNKTGCVAEQITLIYRDGFTLFSCNVVEDDLLQFLCSPTQLLKYKKKLIIKRGRHSTFE